MPITKLDINAMKKADTICFRTVKNKSTIECSIDPDTINPFGKKHIFNVQSKISAIHGMSPENANCFSFYKLYDFNFCPLKTVINLLREEDTINLVWYKGAGDISDLKENNFISDHLYIEVLRKEKVKYNFLIQVSTGRNNSSRMIRSK